MGNALGCSCTPDATHRSTALPHVFPVLPPFLNRVSIKYAGAPLAGHRGGRFPLIKASTTHAKPPAVLISGAEKGKYYTLVMHDPDAPTRRSDLRRFQPLAREFFHWVVTDIDGASGGAAHTGKVVLPYVGVAAPYGSGKHRYCFWAFEQTE